MDNNQLLDAVQKLMQEGRLFVTYGLLIVGAVGATWIVVKGYLVSKME